jgi:hypothetical protein
MYVLKDIFELHLAVESYFKVLLGCSHNNRLYVMVHLLYLYIGVSAY